MNLWGLVKKSLSFYWRTNLGVLLAVMVSTAVLTGALVVGDSVRHSLMMMVNARLGSTQLALVSQNRFFTAELADELSAELNVTVSPVLRLRGLIANSDDTRLANKIEVLGVDERFFEIGSQQSAEPFWSDWSQGVALNEPLAERLRVVPGDEVKLRIEKPGLMPREVPLTPDSDLSVLFRPTVKVVAGIPQFGRFGLQANQIAPLNVFVPLRWLQENMDHQGHANMLLVAASEQEGLAVERAESAIKKRWRLADAGLEIRTLDGQKVREVRSSRIFIDELLSDAASDGSIGILTYFVNELRVGDKATPYSTVAAMTPSASGNSFIAADMRDDEILINQWLADDLEAKEGDSIELVYFVVGSMRKLVEKTNAFTVRRILPLAGPAIDPELMPDFPGLADANNCRDWEPGIGRDLLGRLSRHAEGICHAQCGSGDVGQQIRKLDRRAVRARWHIRRWHRAKAARRRRSGVGRVVLSSRAPAWHEGGRRGDVFWLAFPWTELLFNCCRDCFDGASFCVWRREPGRAGGNVGGGGFYAEAGQATAADRGRSRRAARSSRRNDSGIALHENHDLRPVGGDNRRGDVLPRQTVYVGRRRGGCDCHLGDRYMADLAQAGLEARPRASIRRGALAIRHGQIDLAGQSHPGCCGDSDHRGAGLTGLGGRR